MRYARATNPRPLGPLEPLNEYGFPAGDKTPGKRTAATTIQLRSTGASRVDDPSAVARAGLVDPPSPLPYLDRIQASFGRHDATGIRAHVGGAATDAAERLGAAAYATGTSVAFGREPDLHTAAHEAAHVVQQRAGVQLLGGVGASGDAYERHADAVADAVVRGESVEALLDAHPGGAGSSGGVQLDEEDDATDVDEVNYVFYFTGGDAYGRAARAYIEANYPDYRAVDAGSLEEMFERMYRDLRAHRRSARGGSRFHVGHVILVSHASVAAPEGAELDDPSVATQGELYIAPTRGSDEHVSAATLAELQAEFRAGAHRRLREHRRDVIEGAIDENTMIEVRGCRIAQSDETMAALRSVFGGSAEVRAPEGYQGYAILPFDESRLTLDEAVEILIEQGSAPATLRDEPEAERRRVVEDLVRRYGGLPTQHFIRDGDREAFGALSHEEQLDHLSAPRSGDAADLATRDQVDLPSTAEGAWRYADGGDDDAALRRLSREELETRARALVDPYRPENAPMLRRLRLAWLEVTMGEDDASGDPIAGLAPEEIFGDASTVDRDAARVARGHDSFEERDIVFSEPTERQREVLAGGPDSVSVLPEAEPADSSAGSSADSSADSSAGSSAAESERAPTDTAGAGETETAPRRPRRSRRRATGGSGRTPERAPGEAESPEAAGGAAPLALAGRDGNWLVFNRPAFRYEVARYLWGGSLVPTREELYARQGELRGSDGIVLEIDDTHWALARTAFAARPDLYERMRPEARALLDDLPNLAAGRPPARPDWVPADVWERFLRAGPGVHRYADRSPIETDLILIRRDGMVAGYAEAQTDEETLFRQLGHQPPTVVERILGMQSPEQHAIHLLATANQGYNRFMYRAVTSGRDPYQAREDYREAVNQAYIAAFVAAVGFMGSMAPLLASGAP